MAKKVIKKAPPKPNKVDTNKKKLLEALEKSLGVVTTACKLVGVSRTIHYEYVNTDPKYAAAVLEISEVAIDFAESQLHKQIQSGEVSSTIFYLKTKGKKRGYYEKMEVDNTNKNLPTDIDYQKLSDSALEEIANATIPHKPE